MQYHGNNPVGLALAADTHGEVRAAMLQTLDDYLASAEQRMSASAVPATYRRNLAAVECAAVCAQVVKEFHAVCVSAAAGHSG